MIILGIDPGTAITGYGVVRRENHNQFTVLGYGAIRTPAKQRADHRLKTIYAEIRKLIIEFEPDCMAIEQLFFNKNANSALAVGQARGVAILAGSHSGLEITEYTPLQVKMAVTGYGKASKDQVGYMVRVLLGLSEVPRPDDAADALAICLCHGYNSRKWGA
ncbi:MAG TPA: crossover junction endodeoxyribonuclease RuvC [Corynebacteriales bacterium]|jgi:crossover junction endodeoxyribonuclease RuvC|nr:crossover junction endodeoxyribonuclease RuvC [Bacillota bacterium]HHY08804.1 crossover junction endodeoxyribonuclease RuvC [Mycobacteriales bacterium]